MTTRYDYKIAAAYNNAAGLVNIETIVPSGDRAFFSPVAYSNYRPGVRKIRSDGMLYLAGFGTSFWIMPAATRKQIEYLMDTYCAGGYSGKVTIRTRINRVAYANYNAILSLPDPDAMKRIFKGFDDLRIDYTRMVAI